MMTVAIFRLASFSDKMFYRLLAGSAAISLAAIAMVLYSMFMVYFYKNMPGLAGATISEGARENERA